MLLDCTKGLGPSKLEPERNMVLDCTKEWGPSKSELELEQNMALDCTKEQEPSKREESMERGSRKLEPERNMQRVLDMGRDCTKGRGPSKPELEQNTVLDCTKEQEPSTREERMELGSRKLGLSKVLVSDRPARESQEQSRTGPGSHSMIGAAQRTVPQWVLVLEADTTEREPHRLQVARKTGQEQNTVLMALGTRVAHMVLVQELSMLVKERSTREPLSTKGLSNLGYWQPYRDPVGCRPQLPPGPQLVPSCRTTATVRMRKQEAVRRWDCSLDKGQWGHSRLLELEVEGSCSAALR
jgi:hypothetical protein